jgi:hypothetical protein
LKLLLTDPRADTSYNDQAPLRTAIAKKNPEALKLLLPAKRVTNSTFFQSAIRDAVSYRFSEGVKLLLADSDFDPRADESAIRHACDRGYLDIIKLFLADERVDPSVNDQSLIRSCLRSFFDLRLDSVVVLLSDSRVQVPTKELRHDRPILTALMLLRRSFRQGFSRSPNLTPQFKSLITEIDSIESERRTFLDVHLIPDLVGICLEYVPDLFCHRIDIPQPRYQFRWRTEFHTDLSEAPRLISFGSLSTM